MVTFPPEFVATKYPGYFFNTQDQKLYSIKVSGVLKSLQFQKPNFFNKLQNTRGGYHVSVRGRRKWLLVEYLSTLSHEDSVIPVFERTI